MGEKKLKLGNKYMNVAGKNEKHLKNNLFKDWNQYLCGSYRVQVVHSFCFQERMRMTRFSYVKLT